MSLPPDPIDYAARPLIWRLWRRYRLIWRRRYRLFKAFRARHDLRCLSDNTDAIRPDDILCFVTMKNEADKIPYFLEYHRSLGVDHFLIVDNDSTDRSQEFLMGQSDISVWHTTASYRDSKFGIAWVGWLLRKYGTGHWCLTLDCDELMIIPNQDRWSLRDLVQTLTQRKMRSFRTVMVELFPKGPIGEQAYEAGDNPVETLPYFDADNFVRYEHPELCSLIEKGGVRARYFYADSVKSHGPHMQKTPLVKWRRFYAYLDSTHTVLPRYLNRNFDEGMISGALLHTKFLPSVVQKSAQPSHRQQHFTQPDQYEAYYAEIAESPEFWHEGAVKYENWAQLVELGLMSDGRQT